MEAKRLIAWGTHYIDHSNGGNGGQIELDIKRRRMVCGSFAVKGII